MLTCIIIGITHIQVDVDKVYDYLEVLATPAVTPILTAPQQRNID